MPDWPFPSCDWPAPGNLRFDRPDGTDATDGVEVVDIGPSLGLTRVAPGRVLIDWPGLDVLPAAGGPGVAAVHTFLIGNNLTLSSPSAGVARLDAGGGGSPFQVIGGPGPGTLIFPCVGLGFDFLSGIDCEPLDVDSPFGVVSLLPATPSQSGAVTTDAQKWSGHKTIRDGLLVGFPSGIPFGGNEVEIPAEGLLGGSCPGLIASHVFGDPLTGDLIGGTVMELICGFTDLSVGYYFWPRGSSFGIGGSGFRKTSFGVSDELGNFFGGVWQDFTDSAGNVLSFKGGLFIGGNPGPGVVTSVDASGGTTGLTFGGGPVTGVGTLTLGGTLGVGSGGTGGTTPDAGLTNLLPPQAGHAGEGLITDGATAGWAPLLPPQAGHAGEVLTTDGVTATWQPGGGGGGGGVTLDVVLSLVCLGL